MSLFKIKSAESFIRKELSGIIKDDVDKVSSDRNFMDLGVDSTQLISLVKQLEIKLETELYPTLFFEYQNISELSGYLAEEYPQLFEVESVPQKEEVYSVSKEVKKTNVRGEIQNENIATPDIPSIKPLNSLKDKSENKPVKDPIAIVGAHGVFPDSKNKEEFWEHLYNKSDLIKEIPKDHFDCNPWYDSDPEAEDKMYCKWGSFIDDVDKFDAQFFNISPREAEIMDPQLRYLLQVLYGTAEDAGVINSIKGTNTGIYLGVCFHDYEKQMAELNPKINPYDGTGNAAAMLANRPSFYFNLTGPSLSIDTACSSSLVALHIAAKAIENGECDQAFVAGANLLLSSDHYRYFCSIGALSPTGRSHSFDSDADGYVPGESVAAVLLKPLSQAKKDGDRIYGIVKGGAVSHGGYTPSITAPSVDGEVNVLIKAWEDAGISPDSLGYIEAHGTGTKLGDPIEVNALKKAFKKSSIKDEEGPSIAIGSAKAHIGHTEGAAGIVGIIKALLSINHKIIPAMPKFESINPYIKLDDSPFYINKDFQQWEIERNVPRRAGVSSFGFGGAYAHIVLEEYMQEQVNYESNDPAIIVLSARNKDRLKDQVSNLLIHLEQNKEISLYDIAYTLQIGRESMEERLAFMAFDLQGLKSTLNDYLKKDFSELHTGNIKKDKNDFVLKGNAGKSYIAIAIQDKELDSLAQLWVKGVKIDWDLLYGENRPSKISLPTYPFAQERYWIPDSDILRSTISIEKLHPLLHINSSNLKEQRFTNTYTGQESFLFDHKIRGEKVLPGVAYLEMARAAGAISLEEPITQIKDVIWLTPIGVNDDPEQIQISLFDEGDFVGYEVYSDSDSAIVHSQGRLSTGLLPEVSPVDIKKLKAGLSNEKLGVDYYPLLKSLDLDLGPSFQGIEKLYYNKDYSLSRISLSKEDGYVLQPGLLDCALQCCIGWSLLESASAIHLPFSVKEVNIYGDLSDTVWCYARRSATNNTKNKVINYDIDMLSDTGDVLLNFRDFSALPIDGFNKGSIGLESEESSITAGLHLYGVDWEARSIGESQVISEQSNLLVLLAGGSIVLGDTLKASLGEEVLAINEATELGYYQKVQELLRSRLDSKEGVDIILLYCNSDYVDYSFISGLLKTAEIEGGARLFCKTVGVDSLSLDDVDGLVSVIESESGFYDKEVRHLGSKREVRRLSPLPISSEVGEVGIKPEGVYLITGGSGGLGQIFASHISKTKGTQLILTGRSPECRLSKEELQKLNAVYHSCDITNPDAVAILIKEIVTTYGTLDGVIHSAGIVKDSFLLNKTKEESALVLRPKILGTKYLDESTKELNLDFMVYFSSISGVMGNVGQGDYASANAWMDTYAQYRNRLHSQGKRHGITLSINWPLWEEGGIKVDKESQKYLQQKWGMTPLSTSEGLSAFDRLLGSPIDQGVVVYGDSDQMSKKILGTPTPVKKVIESSTVDIDSSIIGQQVTAKIIKVVSGLLKFDISKILIDKDLGDYGFDSILMTKFNNELNAYYDLDLMPTLFYNYPTIELLVEYLLEAHLDRLQNKHGIVAKEVIAKPDIGPSIVRKRSRFTTSKSSTIVLEKEVKKRGAEGVAIVGVSGRFPGSPDLNVFWENLRDNKDLITEVPESRWDWREYYGDSHKEIGKTKSKWGGFIEDIDKFDPSFFNISPREATLMDPQQRIALEAVCEALENAGITTGKIKGSNTGVFLGVSSSDYAMLLGEQKALVNQANYPTGVSHSVLVNRISYLLDLHGPSEPIDTACSSSLIAIHRAVENIRLGHCDMSIAGGVNALLSPDITLAFSQAGMLSEDGRCKTFDQSANGYVRAEGVGIVILKSLSQAEADGDHIYGVIRGTAENHGGKANTLTSPNPNAQKELLLKAYRFSGIDPRDVSYIEAHGTGTPLGDPIEIEGLKLAFKELYKDHGLDALKKAYCGVGSVKANIGHLEAAAGIAGVMKVLLSLKHKTLPGNIHLDTPNEYLELKNSPFYLRQETEDWLVEDNKPRIAGVSGFGFGGANSHIIIEEYIQAPTNYQSNDPAVIVLSARGEDRLKDQVSNLLMHLEENKEISLYDIAYTLQIGRDPMEERLAFMAFDLQDLKSTLNDYKEGKFQGVFRGNVKNDTQDFLLKGGAGKAYMDYAIANKEGESLIQLWVKGVVIDWNLLYDKDHSPNKISLPTYPFARDRYWYRNMEEVGLKKLDSLLPLNNSESTANKVTTDFKPENNSEVITKDRLEYTGEETERRIAFRSEIASIAYDIFGISEKDLSLTLSPVDHDFNSINMIQFVREVNKCFGVEVEVRQVFNANNLESIFDLFENAVQRKAFSDKGREEYFEEDQWVNIEKEAQLIISKDIDPLSYVYPEKIRQVFLTGATGFVGIYLLKELLKNKDIHIHCLVRAKDQEDGIKRILDGFSFYQLPINKNEIKRIHVVIGDLSKPNLGIETNVYKELSREIDFIYHNGALVNLIMDYDQIKPINVDSVRSIIDFATAGKIKMIHYISTLAVVRRDVNKNKKVSEDDAIVNEKHIKIDGYPSSKCVGEQLVKNAMSLNIPCNIYRLGNVIGDQSTGVLNPKDFFSSLLLQCIALKKTPSFFENEELHMIPVNMVAKSVVALSFDPNLMNRSFHIMCKNMEANKVFERLDTKLNTKVDSVSNYNFLQSHKMAIVNENNQLLENPVLEQFHSLPEQDLETMFKPFERKIIFDVKQTCKVLKNKGITMRLDMKSLDMLLKHLIQLNRVN